MLGVIQGLGWQELLIVLVIVLVLFGAKRLPEIAKSLGKAGKEFREASKDLAGDVKSGLEDDTTAPKAAGSQDRRSEE